MTKIVLDIFGCDSPDAVFEGIVAAARRFPDVVFAVAGAEELIKEKLAACIDCVEVIPATSVITNDCDVSTAIVTMRDSTTVRALTALKNDDEAVGMISMGNTGALLVGSAVYLGRLPGVVRPALASLLPTAAGGYMCLLDCGANVDCAPEQLPPFAVMATALMQSRGVQQPAVALLSVGNEKGKGNTFTRAAYDLLEQAPVRFIGNIEGNDVLSGRADIVLCDGFAGNVLLKGIEGAAKFAVNVMVGALKTAVPAGTDTGFIRQAVGQVMLAMDYTGKAGAVLLGVNKPIIKAHGAATAETVPNVVHQLLSLVESGYTDRLRAAAK